MEEKIDLRIQKTYMALHNAFESLLEEKRFEELTVNELCQRAMIRRTTFYKHFADKYEYFSFYIQEMTRSFQERLPWDAQDGEAGAYMLNMSRELLHFLKEHSQFVRNIKDSSVFPMLLNILVEQISDDFFLVLRRMGSADLTKQEAQGVAAFYAGGLANIFFQYLKEDIPIEEEQLLETLSRLLIL